MIQVTAEALEALSESERQAFDDAHRTGGPCRTGEFVRIGDLGPASDALIIRSVRREHVQDGLAGDLAVEERFG